jgi:AraC-like DNA-binding protein
MQNDHGWSAIAAQSGFADHAHLTREFRALVGLAPTHVASRLDAIEHRNVRP